MERLNNMQNDGKFVKRINENEFEKQIELILKQKMQQIYGYNLSNILVVYQKKFYLRFNGFSGLTKTDSLK